MSPLIADKGGNVRIHGEYWSVTGLSAESVRQTTRKVDSMCVIPNTRNLARTAALLLALCSTSPQARADCEDVLARHMVGEALLAVQLVAQSEKAGMQPAQINPILESISKESAIEEFWITDSSGHAYLTNTGVDFTFSPDPNKQPQASEFWPLITGDKKVVIQRARKREIDDRIFKFVGVAGVDKPRIVQVGVGDESLVNCK